jgi:single-strand DNA-binding protein
MSVNKVILVGNLGRDPELRHLPSGQAKCSFSIATTENFTDRGGQKQERTEWHNIVTWGKTAENCGQYLKKGRQVYVEGRITTRSYEAKDGSGKRYITEIIAQTVQFLGGRGAGMGEEPGEYRGGGGGGAVPPGQGDDVAPMDDEDIPF